MPTHWGTSYHRSQEVRAFLATVNEGLAEADWKITLLQFAPNDPTQNPIEDVWLIAKSWLRSCWHQCKTFDAVKLLFELATHHSNLISFVRNLRLRVLTVFDDSSHDSSRIAISNL
jgi:transposase